MKMTVGKLTTLILIAITSIIDVTWILTNGLPYNQDVTPTSLFVGISFGLLIILCIIGIIAFIAETWNKEL